MKLLVITQKVNQNDPILGFFHNWLKNFAEKFESIEVICLEKGKYNLPKNVKVYSLGKEHKESRLKYMFKFFRYIIGLAREYDVVLIHMNQEYALLGGFFWKILGKKVYLWRNHHAGNFLTDIASIFCNKIFCTSKYSYTAKYKKTVLMPVGVDLDRFAIANSQFSNIEGTNKILFLGRIAPSKNVDIFVEVLGQLKHRSINFIASIYGDALPKDRGYLERIKIRAKELWLGEALKFYNGVPNDQTPEIYNSHGVYVNLSSSGMYDKTIFEALACGCIVLASNDNLVSEMDERFVIKDRTAEAVADKLQVVINLSDQERKKLIEFNINLTNKHSLRALADKLRLEVES